ncbi:MAG: hypothetical protein WAU69_03560 [Solirubrobacteraceae bacterium]
MPVRGAVGKPGGAQRTLHIGDRDQAKWLARRIDDDSAADASERGPFEQAGNILVSMNDQAWVTIDDPG